MSQGSSPCSRTRSPRGPTRCATTSPGTRFRAAYPEIDRRFADVSYLDLTENPVGTVADIYRHFGWVFDGETRARTERWQDLQAERRQAEPRHRYSLARYGLTAPQVDAAFARYAAFARANKVRLDQQAGPVAARRGTLASTGEGVSPWTRTWQAR